MCLTACEESTCCNSIDCPHAQNDMAEMVEQNLHQKLDIEQHTQPHPASKPEKHKKASQKKKKASPSNKENSDDVFRREFIKKSWYF